MKTEKKTECDKGTACGSTCISSRYRCEDKIKTKNSTKLLKTVRGARSAIVLPKAFDKSDPSHKAIYELDVPPDRVKVAFSPPEDYRLRNGSIETNAVEINILVNNTTHAEGSAVSSDNSIKVALSAMRAVKTHVATMPDGTLLTNTAASHDGKGEARVKLYERAGFKRVDDGSNTMYAVVKDGKITPVDIDYVKSNYKSQ